jgi:polyhydroxyalkanoate synthesis regulator phasin
MFDALLAQIKKDDFPGASNRRDSREERIQRLVQEAYQAAVADRRAHATTLQQRIDGLRARCGTLNG